MNFEFHDLSSVKELKVLLDFLRHHNLDYPNYQDWISRTEGFPFL